MKVPSLSFCITCKNRFHQISKTLQKNLDDNRMFKDLMEFVLVDFGSTDGLRDWIVEHFRNELKENYLKYYYTDELPFWHCSIAKNTSHLLAKNEILVNLDCDNYTGYNGGRFVIRQWLKHREKIVLHQFDGNYWCGSYGRIATDRDTFRKFGGYDESFEPASMQDEDLINRLTGAGLKYVYIPDERYNRAIKNGKEETIAYVRSEMDYEEMVLKNRAISEKNLKAGNWTVNNGQWGIRKNLFDLEGRIINITEEQPQ